jgi:hypothetical protein
MGKKLFSHLKKTVCIEQGSLVNLSESNRPVTLHTAGPSAVINVSVGKNHKAYLIMSQDAYDEINAGAAITTRTLEPA